VSKGGACNTHGSHGKCIYNYSRKEATGRYMHTWKDNIKMGIKLIRFKDKGCVHMAELRVQRCTLVTAAMKLQVP
jgi:hypothetical protein